MNALKNIQPLVLLSALALILPPAQAVAQQAAAPHDPQHDFDFEIGSWHTHLKRLQHPLTGSTTWLEYDGTSKISKIWNGRANLVELEVDGPTGHIEGLSLRLYNPQSREWSLNFASSAQGTMSIPTVGEFKNNRGEFYDQESFNNRTILVRNVFEDISANSYRFEQAFSDDGGKTWELNWIAVDTRVPDNNDAAASTPATQETEPQSPTDRQKLGEAWWTGPMLANNASTLPRGHFLVEPYLYDVISPHTNGFGSLPPIEARTPPVSAPSPTSNPPSRAASPSASSPPSATTNPATAPAAPPSASATSPCTRNTASRNSTNSTSFRQSL